MFYRGNLITKDINVEVEYLKGKHPSIYDRWDFYKILPERERSTEENYLRSGVVEWNIPAMLIGSCISSYLEIRKETQWEDNIPPPDKVYGDVKYMKEVHDILKGITSRHFLPEEIVQDGLSFTPEGNMRILECVSEDKNYYMYEVTLNGVLQAYEYRIKDSTLTLTLKSEKLKPFAEIVGLEYREYLDSRGYVDLGDANIRDISYLNLIKDLSWQKYKDYRIIGVKDLDWVCREMRETQGFIGLDTETTGVNLNNSPNSDFIVGIVLSYKDDQSYYFPIAHNEFDNIPLDILIPALKPIIENKKMATANGGFEFKALRPLGVRPNVVIDIFTIIYLSDHSSYTRRNLEVIVQKNYGIETLSLKDIFVGEVRFQDLPPETVIAYACPDADFTRKACTDLLHTVPKDSMAILAEDIICMMNIAEFSEFKGVKLDEEMVFKFDAWNTAEVHKLERLAWRIAGDWEYDRKFDLSSDAQIYNIMYNELNYPKIVLMKDNPNKASTAKKALKELMGISLPSKQDRMVKDIPHENPEEDDSLVFADKINSMAYPLSYVVSLYRKYHKLQTTFFVALKKACEENDGYYYPDYNMFVAATGRIISVIQQMVKSLRGVFLPEEDYYWITADYKQVEYRLMGILSQSEDIIEGLQNPETDAHTLSASVVHQIPMERVTKDMRDDGKIWSFAVPYGVGDYAACEMMFTYPITEDKLRATRLSKAKYLEAHHKVEEYLTQSKELSYENGYIKTKAGRYRFFTYELTSGDDFLYHTVANKGGNMPIQGFAADIFKMAFNNLCDRIRKESETNPEFKKISIPFLVHDEYNLLIPKSIHPYQMVKILREELEIDLKAFGFKYSAPLYTGISVIDNWGEGKFDEYELPIGFTDKVMKEVENGHWTGSTINPKEEVFEGILGYISQQIFEDIIDIQPSVLTEPLKFENIVNYHRLYLIKKSGELFKLTKDQKVLLKGHMEQFKAGELQKNPNLSDKQLKELVAIHESDMKKLFTLSNAVSYHLGIPIEIAPPETIKEENPFLDLDLVGGDEEGDTLTVFNFKEYKRLQKDKEVLMEDLWFEDNDLENTGYLTNHNPRVSPVGKRLLLDVTGCTVGEFQALNDYLLTVDNPLGRYRIVYVWGDTDTPSKLRVSRIPFDELNELLPRKEQLQRETPNGVPVKGHTSNRIVSPKKNKMFIS